MLCVYHEVLLLRNKTAKLVAENSAQTTSRFSPFRYRAPRLAWAAALLVGKAERKDEQSLSFCYEDEQDSNDGELLC